MENDLSQCMPIFNVRDMLPYASIVKLLGVWSFKRVGLAEGLLGITLFAASVSSRNYNLFWLLQTERKRQFLSLPERSPNIWLSRFPEPNDIYREVCNVWPLKVR